MSTSFSLSPLSLYFPIHDPCFGDPSNSSSVCQVPTNEMIAFLNISNPTAYLEAYCLNPPIDSCAFGYCSNPDVASPAVRISSRCLDSKMTHYTVTTIVSAILVLYSPEDVPASFFSQLLNVYSLIVAAIIAIAHRNLTKPHTAVAMSLAASPLSAYLIIYVIRSIIGNQNRLSTVFGKGKWLNRFAVLTIVPVWVAVLVFSALPKGMWHFQQSACDEVITGDRVIRFFFLPVIVLSELHPGTGATLCGVFIITWATCIYLQRREIWRKKNKKLPLWRIWRKVVEAYPFIQFFTVIFIPHCFWFLNIEIGRLILLPRETFTST
ncbi:hypothetical protein B0H13DRAFT_439629 [Mycena leptocephala]|nr:hypothetical protein B0H13DRAFT_439629 [Mycena leptocephala]